MPPTPRRVCLPATPPVMWACNAVVGRLASESIGPLWLNALRWIVAFALLLPLGWAALGTTEARAQIWERWKVLSILGLIGVGAYNALQYLALPVGSVFAALGVIGAFLDPQRRELETAQ